MKSIKLSRLSGMWLSKEGLSSMYIAIDLKRIEICFNGNIMVSEKLSFSYNEELNVCNLSESVLLYQLFDDNEILIRVSINGQVFDLFMKRRPILSKL